MFTPFSKGSNVNEVGWDDTPNYVPGRFHAHISRPSSPPLASTSNSSTPFLPFRTTNITTPLTLNSNSNGEAIPRLPRKGMSRRVTIQEDENENENKNERWILLRPSKEKVESLLDSWFMRYAFMVALPCLIVSCCHCFLDGCCFFSFVVF